MHGNSNFPTDKVFKAGPSKIRGMQTLKFEVIWSNLTDIILNFIKATFHKFH